MVRKSYGRMRGTRYKLEGKTHNITAYIDTFDVGERVWINAVSQGKMPHPKFQGAAGKITGKRGGSYLVEVRDKNAVKKLYVRPEHLKR